MEKILQQLEQEVKNVFHAKESAHDIYHLQRVLNLALTLQKKEGGDRLVIAVVAFLHDLHRVIQKETGKFCSPKDSLPRTKDILDKVQLTAEQKAKILHCIEYHEEYNFSKNGKTANDLETLIVQDADNLDAIGAVGIGRTFAYSGAYNIPMWNPKKPFDREFYDEDEHDPSTLHHFYSKLLKLKDNMNTATAKRMASKRHKFMELFLKEFFNEWAGKV